MKKILTSLFLIMAASTQATELLEMTNLNASELLNQNVLTVVDIYADWCGPCKSLAPILKELNSEYGGKVHFVKLNADRENALSNSYNITGLPTLIFIKNGQEVGRHTGFMSKNELIMNINRHL